MTQRGNGRRFVLDGDADRTIYLRLLRENIVLYGKVDGLAQALKRIGDNALGGTRVIGHTDNAARVLCLTPLLCNVGLSYSEESAAEVLYHGKTRLWIEPVSGRL